MTTTTSTSMNTVTVNSIGAQGPAGSTGPAGTSVLNGTSAPQNSDGNNGDFFLETTNSRLYGPKAAGAWPSSYVSLVGPAGSTGSSGSAGLDGSDGQDGKTLLNGSGSPNGGNDGDFWIDTTNNRIYGPKASGSWPSGFTSIVGPQGLTGSAGSQGLQGIQGIQGIQGPVGNTGPTGNFGGATFDYTFDTSIVDSDPGTGKARFNNANISSATLLYIDDTDDGGTDVQAYLRTIDDSTSTIKGHFKVSNKTDPNDFALFTISAATEATGYHKVTCAYVSGSTSFSASEDIVLTFARTGDKGDTGSTGSAASISVGSVSTTAPGSSATVSNSGSSSAATFDFTIPRGDTGATGSAATVTAGTTTTSNPGTNAAVSNSGSSSAATFDFTIPRGATGASGSDGKTLLNGSGTPASGLGNNDDFYIDTTNNVIYGPKASGAWGSGTSYLQGQDGQDGQDGQGITDGDKGDVVVSNTGTVWTVDNNAITNAKILDDTIAESKLDIHGGGPSGTNKFLGYTANGMEWAVPPDTQYSVGDNGLTKNNFTDALKTKLDAIETSATADQTGAEIKTAYEAESNTNAFTDTEKSKLAAIEASATADQTGAEIKTAYEAESDTNALTDALKTKLEGVEASATADQTGAEIKSAYEGESNTNAFTDAEKTKLSGVAASANNYAISADLLDEDNMSTNSATKVPSQQSVKAYVDANSSDTQYTAGTGLQLSGTQFSVTSLALTTVQEASSQSAQLALTTQEGDIVVRTDENKTYCKNSGTAGTMADFTLLRTPTDAVTSINSQTGAITANQIAAAVEAASDSNTFTDADHSKLNAIEASATADQTGAEIKTAYEAESDTNAYTDAEKSKLAAIEASATGDQTNAEIRAAVEAATDSNVFTDADHNKLDGISASANNYSISSDLLDEDNMASNSSSKVASQQSIKAYVDANTGTTDLSYTASSRELASSTGVNVTLPEATTSNAGLQSSSDKSKLDGIASGAEVNVNGDWNSNSGDSEILNKPTIPTNNNQLSNGAGYTTNTGTVTGVSASGSITSTGGTSPTIGIDAATTSAAGSMSSSDKSKLDGIAAGATNTAVPYYTSAISVGDGGLTQKNFTTTLKTKLDGISTGAEANVNADWNSGSGSSQILNKPTLFSGSYNDLSNKPTIPTNNNQLTNGSNYVTSSIISSLDAGNLSSGKVPIGRLGSSGTASSSTFLAGDNSWQTISTGLPSGGTFTADVTFTGTSSKNCVWDVSDSAFEFAQAAQIKLGGHSFQENAYGYLVLDNHSTGNGAYFKFNNQINLNSAIIKFENYGGNQDIFKATTGSIISYAGGTEKFKVDTTGIVVSGGISEEITTITSSSNAATLDQDTATNFVHDLTENVTYTFTNGGVAGTVRSFTLKIIQDSSARTITWPASVDWAGGTAPTLSTGNNDVDVFVFITYDGGSTYYGFTAGQDLS